MTQSTTQDRPETPARTVTLSQDAFDELNLLILQAKAALVVTLEAFDALLPEANPDHGYALGCVISQLKMIELHLESEVQHD